MEGFAKKEKEMNDKMYQAFSFIQEDGMSLITSHFAPDDNMFLILY